MSNTINTEILPVIEAVAIEKGISKANVVSIMEQAIQAASQRKYGLEHNIRARIDHNTGEVGLYKVVKVVDVVVNIFTEISLEDAINRQPGIKIGEEIHEKLPAIDLGRITAYTAKRVINRRVSEVERVQQFEDYKNRKGDILNGIVKRIEFDNIFIDVGRAEAVLRKEEQIRNELIKIGDRIKAYVQDVRLEPKGPQIFLSRSDDRFLAKLFEMEVPEIYDNQIEIKAIGREPGSKAKIAVFSSDINSDPVASCVGVRGSRVNAVSNELGGEKIDVIAWDKNIAQFIINAMTPAEITKIVFEESTGKVEAIVPNDQLSLAIGRRGQNVRLASKITGWRIEVITEEQESKRRSEEFTNSTELFMNVLAVDEVTAQLLSAEGFNSIEQLALEDDNVLGTIKGIGEELIAEIRERAAAYIDAQNEEIIVKLEKLGVEQGLLDILDLPPQYILNLAEYGIKTIEDLTTMSVSEFRRVIPENILSEDDIQLLIDFASNQIKED